MEGRPDAWQRSESAQDFVNRCPPLSSEGLGPWLWVYNPNPGAYRSKVDHFTKRCAERCEELLSTYLQTENRIQAEMEGKAKGTITRKLTPLRATLRDKLLAVAREEDAVCGKVGHCKWTIYVS